MLKQLIWHGLVIFAVAWCGRPAAAQRMPVEMPCPPGLDGSCAPRRVTYGYYPTTWRRWPTHKPTPAKPAGEPRPAVVAPETAPQQPAEQETPPEQSLEAPSRNEPEAPMTLPFEEQPSEPEKQTPSDSMLPGPLTKPQEPGSQEEPPVMPPRAETPETEDKPPVMPEENPFKDDPPESPQNLKDASPAPPTTSRDDPPEPPKSLSEEALEKTERGPRMAKRTNSMDAAVSRWRLTAHSTIDSSANSVVEVPKGDEPILLPALETVPTVPSEGTSVDEHAVRNPLRAKNDRPRESQVTAATHWSAERTAEKTAEASRKRNPLRDN